MNQYYLLIHHNDGLPRRINLWGQNTGDAHLDADGILRAAKENGGFWVNPTEFLAWNAVTKAEVKWEKRD